MIDSSSFSDSSVSAVSSASTVGEVRDQLKTTLILDADFEAFCLDYFPSVKRRFSGNMDRVIKENLLLELQEASEIVASLRKWLQRNSAALEASELVLDDDDSLKRRVHALSEQLTDLYTQHERMATFGQDTSALAAQILKVRSQMRRGPQLHLGEVLDHRFRLDQEIGRGGFATVFKAYDRQRHRVVAIKVLHGQYSQDRTHIERFRRGAMRMAELHHEAIVPVLGSVQRWEGFYYFVMSYLPRGDLHCLVTRDRIGAAAALRMVLRVGTALAFAHERGLIHRDVKPGNILIDDAGRAHLTDFDLVRAADSTGVTRTGAMGTFIFAAPEQMEDASCVDVRADVFSLGMTALFGIYGQNLPVYAYQNASDFIGRMKLPQLLKEAIVHAVAWDLTTRFPSISEFCRALEPGLSALVEESGADSTAQPPELYSWLRDRPLAVPQIANAPPTPELTSSLLPGGISLNGLRHRRYLLGVLLLIGGAIALLVALSGLLSQIATRTQQGVLGELKEFAGAGLLASATSALTVERNRLSVGNAAVSGPETAKVTIIEFFDYRCPFCSQIRPTIEKIESTYSQDVRVVYKHNPLPFLPNATNAARAAMAAREQGEEKFWAFHKQLFDHQDQLDDEHFKQIGLQVGLSLKQFTQDLVAKQEKFDTELQANRAEAARYGANVTPVFFINGRPLRGAQPFEHFQKIIDEELANADRALKAGIRPKQLYATLVQNGKEETATSEDGNDRAMKQPSNGEWHFVCKVGEPFAFSTHSESGIGVSMAPNPALPNPLITSAQFLSACRNGHGDLVSRAVGEGMELETTTGIGATCLTLASDGNYSAMVRLLLAKGANVNHRDSIGVTPLYSAALGGHIDIVEQLLAHGADKTLAISSVDYQGGQYYGWTPLTAARCCGAPQIA